MMLAKKYYLMNKFFKNNLQQLMKDLEIHYTLQVYMVDFKL